MKRPIIFTVDDDNQVLNAIVRDLRSEYRKHYRILSTASANEALEALVDLKRKDENIALFLSDQRMPEMLGVDYLEKARELFPDAKRVLLTAYSDIDAAIKAINDVQLDYYLMKPWDPPDEKLFPILNDLLSDWHSSYKPGYGGVRVIGFQWSPQSHKIKDFLAGNLIPYRWMDIESDKNAKQILAENNIEQNQLPALFFEDGDILLNPELREIGDKSGLKSRASAELYDTVIIGAGPSGLAAGVYGGSEGLKTLLIERRAPGGQAGTSSRIENYLGFPSGLSGSDLARRAITQATRFGVEFLSPQIVKSIRIKDNYKIITLTDDSEIQTKSIVISTGVEYRKLQAVNIEKFTGAGVYYGAASTEAHACKNTDVYIVGGGNSAGQAAMYLSRFAKNVYICIRRDSLSYTMSQYLIDQIGQTENINLLTHTEIVEIFGEERLEALDLIDTRSKEIRRVNARTLFVFIGAKPATDWIEDSILKNERKFLLTGRDLPQHPDFSKKWPLKRDPYFLETSIPGIFASGDVRANAMNRVASAVGEGAMAIKFVHQYLAEN